MINYELLKDEAKKLGVELDEYALDRFDTYAERLVRWNEHVNLTSITEPDEIVIKHFVDSLSVQKYITFNGGETLADVGCGAGFPSMPLLIANPDLDVTFIDSLGKRLAFIKEILQLTGLFGQVLHERAEDAGRQRNLRDSFDYVTARAVAPLNVLCEYCLPLVREGGTFVSLKGSDVMSEVNESESAIELLGGKLFSVEQFELPNGDKRSLVFVKKISQTPTKYPRKPKKISTHPL